MTAPSNANTSGPEVVAWAFRHGRDTRAVWLGPVRPEHWSDSEGHALVTAASAQARIDAAEARADRLAKALDDIASGYANCDDFQDAQAIARAALQQETQP